jgi:demethylmenaquinone methyltransferase/2-methoxy-6-polyprenyl-1,4-benzoquinol methylase
MFSRIARRYDLLNTIMTAGRHHAWRRMATELAVAGLSGPALDVAAGTGDFAITLAKRSNVSHVVGVDNTPAMLAIAAAKTRHLELAPKIGLVRSDALELPFPADQFICATVGFGVRNFIDIPRALREMGRVVRPGGRVVILEIVQLEGRNLMGKLFPVYFRHLVPWLGALLAGDKESYEYLPESVDVFLTASKLATIMEEAGLVNVSFRRLALGTVAIHVGEKPGADS